MRKRLLASVVAGVLLLSGAAPAGAAMPQKDAITDGRQAEAQIRSAEQAGFTDSQPGTPFHEEVRWLAERGLSKGYADGSYGKGLDITRGELASLLHRYVDPATGDQTEADLLDVRPEATHSKAIAWASDAGLVHGYTDGTFRPSRSITRGELSSIIHRLAAPVPGAGADARFLDVRPADAHSGAIIWLASEGIIHGYEDGTFRPGKPITRGETSKILYGYALRTEERPLVDLGHGVQIWTRQASEVEPLSVAPTWKQDVWPASIVPEHRDPYSAQPIASGQTVNALPGVTVEPGEALLVWHGLDHSDEEEMRMARRTSLELLAIGSSDLEIFWQTERPGTEGRPYYSGADGLAWSESDAIWMRGEGWWWDHDPQYAVRVAAHEALHHQHFRLVGTDGAPAGANAVNTRIASITGNITDPGHALLACAHDHIPGHDVVADPRCTEDPAWAAATTAIMQGRLPQSLQPEEATR